ncbi:MAG TPA: alpha/beta hydrolase [Candidatus Nanopelagicaceae bacterium]|nr:alpha/beta hydrolase [Candidatus Nanopelagicaceae bacterium]
MNSLEIENIDIPIKDEDLFLKGTIYSSSNTPKKAPFIINLAGLLDHRESYFVKYYTEKFADAGYNVLSYDYRAHGETKKQTGSRWDRMVVQIFSDIQIVIDWVLTHQSYRLLEEKIILFGRSIGGAIILTQGFLNKKVKTLIALCARYDYHSTTIKFQEEIVQKISPKYFLKDEPLNNKRILIAHCKDDNRIPFSNLSQIQNQLGLNVENVLQFEAGGHSFKGHREDIFNAALKFIKKI